MAKIVTLVEVKNTEYEAKVKELKEWKALKEQAEQKIKELEGDIKSFMIDSIKESNIAIGPFKCTISTVNRGTFDKELVHNEAPELFEKASGTTTYMRLTVK
jgi:predicted phage-related endonuclease